MFGDLNPNDGLLATIHHPRFDPNQKNNASLILTEDAIAGLSAIAPAKCRISAAELGSSSRWYRLPVGVYSKGTALRIYTCGTVSMYAFQGECDSSGQKMVA